MSKELIGAGYRPYDMKELFEKINAIEIIQNGNQVVTKYLNRVVNTTTVSGIYEIFDISSFMISKIDQLAHNFPLTWYKFNIKRGIQELVLLSSDVNINDTNYQKAFFILNSSDKTRRLNMNMGLYRSDNNSYFASSIKNMSLSKKHLRGVTRIAEEVSQKIDIETFDEQIKSIKSLVGERVLLSQVRDIIVDKNLKVNHMKFDALKNSIRWSRTDRESGLSSHQIETLMTPSDKLNINYLNDFSIDAYRLFNCYLQIFSRQDSYIVRKETDKILKITQCFIRNERINKLLDLA
jgi:hypothetical protein